MAELAQEYVCAADEVWRLQRGSEVDCLFFQRAINDGERVLDGGSRQGAWIFAGSGELLAHRNTRNVEAMVALLEDGLRAFEELPAERRRLAEGVDLTSGHRWESNRPQDGLVLERIGRELLGATPEGERSRFWNRDHAWFARAELVEALAPLLEDAASVELPLLATRLARFHLVDNVRGQSLPYMPMEVERARLTANVVQREGARYELELVGETAAASDGSWLGGENSWKPKRGFARGIRCELLGRALWDAERGAFERFELVAVGRRWGRTENNGRGRDDSPGRVAFVLRPGGTGVAPTFVSVYDADWIVRPAVPTWRDDPAEVGLAR